MSDLVNGLVHQWRQRRARQRAHHRYESNRRRWTRRASDAGDGCSDVGDCCPCDGFSLAALVLAVAGAWRADARDPWTTPRSPAARAASRLVRSYQVNVSARRPAVCPMSPSCSRYALTALSRHGALRGGRLVVARLRRCSPRRAGADPVPA